MAHKHGRLTLLNGGDKVVLDGRGVDFNTAEVQPSGLQSYTETSPSRFLVRPSRRSDEPTRLLAPLSLGSLSRLQPTVYLHVGLATR